jgi:UDPglucose 6-dehydrogenase
VIRELYEPFVRNQHPILLMSRTAAEVTKYAANAYLATRISFINEIANICDACGVDVDEVRRGIGTDARIGFHFLFPGAGYGGSCFPKDVQALAHSARSAGYSAAILDAVHNRNLAQRRLLFDKLTARLGADLSKNRFAFWGVTFKPKTDDVREAPSLTLISLLLEAGASVAAYDPEGLDNLDREFGDRVDCVRDAYTVLDGADALIIATEWNEFRSPDFDRMRSLMKSPLIFDGRNVYTAAAMRRHGFEYHSIGRPPVKP